MIQFQAKYIPSLMRFQATNDIRYYLNGIHVVPHKDGGVVLVATDGHKMLVIRDVNGFCGESMIFNISKGLDMFCKVKNAIVTINDVTERLIISENGNELFVQPGKCAVNGTFPDFVRVLPDFEKLSPGSGSTVKGELLSKAILAHPDIKSVYRNSYGAVNMWQDKTVDGKPLVIEYDGFPEMVGIVMPLYASAKEHQNWIEQSIKNFNNDQPIA